MEAELALLPEEERQRRQEDWRVGKRAKLEAGRLRDDKLKNALDVVAAVSGCGKRFGYGEQRGYVQVWGNDHGEQ